MTVEFRVLGPVEVRLDGVAIPIGPRQQAILALLLIEPNRLVPLDHIIDRVWPDKRPARPANAVQTQLTLLRRALPGVAITWQTGGYQLATDEKNIDLHQFRHEAGLARKTTDDQQAAKHWAAAIEQWRGDPFAGIDLPWFASTRASLITERESATLEQADTLLRLGRYDELLPDLTARSTQRPLDERLAGQFMRALHGARRTAEALRHYEVLRDRLADELGADPSSALREIHQQISTGSGQGPVPRQLPAAPRSFTGRRIDKAREVWETALRISREHKRFAELHRLEALLAELAQG